MITDQAISRIIKEDNVKNTYYELYDAETGSGTVNRPLSIIIYVEMLPEDKYSVTKKGIIASNNISDFPLLYESPQSQIKFLVNGGVGLYNDENALFGQGTAFTQGNPIANNPAGEGNRFWLESFVEPGISAISKLGQSNAYWYGEASALVSARNTDDIYSSGSTAYFAFERLYGGFLATGLGNQKNITINANYGRNFFQLNDGFLFSRFSGSSNAGERGSVYSSSRTTYKKTVIYPFNGIGSGFRAISSNPRNCSRTANRTPIMPSALSTITTTKISIWAYPIYRPQAENRNTAHPMGPLQKKACT